MSERENRFDDEMLTRKEAAMLLKVNKRTLANWASKGEGPKFFHLRSQKGPVRYWQSEVIRWSQKRYPE